MDDTNGHQLNETPVTLEDGITARPRRGTSGRTNDSLGRVGYNVTSGRTYEWNMEASISFSLELRRARPNRIDTG